MSHHNSMNFSQKLIVIGSCKHRLVKKNKLSFIFPCVYLTVSQTIASSVALSVQNWIHFRLNLHVSLS